MPLDLSSLTKSVRSLDRALAIATPDRLAALDPDTREVLKAGVIQNFEFTYEISHKMLKRFLEMTSANPQGIDEMSFPDLIRTGSEQGLLWHGWNVWKDYRKARGTTSHIYDEGKAAEVLAVIPAFFEEARFLLDKLEQRVRETD